MDVVINLIQTMGFPIACCVFLGYYIKMQNAQYREDVKKLSDEYREDVKHLTEEYKAAIADFSKSMDKNTEVLNRLDAKWTNADIEA